MSTALQLPARRGDVGSGRRRGIAAPPAGPVPAADRGETAAGIAPVRMGRYLPLALLVTGLVIAAPAVLAAAIVPRGGALPMIASAACAAALATALASAGAAIWKRQPRSRDVVFADLLLWGWVRRCWTERRLSQARGLYDSARNAGPMVRIEVLTGLGRLLEGRDSYTHGHGQRVARSSARIARAMHLSSVEIAKIHVAAALHDLGKLYTPRTILNNPRRLTDDEFAVVKRHPVDGAEMLAAVGDPEIAAMVRHHHERVDGHGYPDGLTGSDIPLGARIIAVADTFDSIVSSRPYRSARTHKKALDVLSNEAGCQLDEVAVGAFLGRYSARRSVAWYALASAVPQRIVAGLTASLGIGANAGAAGSIVPALGAVGLLAMSPGPHQKALGEQHAHRMPAPVRSHRLPAPVASHRLSVATAGAKRDTRQTASARPTSPARRRGRGGLRTPSGTPGSTRPAASTPNTPVGAGTTPIPSTGPPPPHTTSSPTPTQSPVAPPVDAAPTIPAPPLELPVTVPSVSASVPSATVSVSPPPLGGP